MKDHEIRVTIDLLRPLFLLGSTSAISYKHQNSDEIKHQGTKEPPTIAVSTEQLQEKRPNKN